MSRNFFRFCSLWAVYLGLVVSFCTPAFANSTYEWDGIKKIIAIGDVHGDFEGLKNILLKSELIDQNGDWIGQDTHLVMMGDLVAGGAGSKKILDLLMLIEKQAVITGGKVHSLLGNHDLIAASGDFSSLSKDELLSFSDNTVSGRKSAAKLLKELFLGNGTYANWMSERPLMIRINNQLFLHAGLDERASGFSIEQINAIAKEWLLYFQKNGSIPDPSTSWVVGLKNGKFKRGEGPAFNRDFKVTRQIIENGNIRPYGAIKRKTLKELIEGYGAKNMVIGHVPTPAKQILLDHPYYDDMVICIDTRISDKKHGRLSALEISSETIQPRYFKRSSRLSSKSCRQAASPSP